MMPKHEVKPFYDRLNAMNLSYGKAWAIAAMAEGHRPKPIKQNNFIAPDRTGTHGRDEIEQVITDALSKPRTNAEVAKKVGITAVKCRRIINDLMNDGTVVSFGRRMVTQSSAQVFIASEYQDQFTPIKSTQDLVLETIGDGALTVEQISKLLDIPLELAINATGNLRRKKRIKNLSPNTKTAVYQRTGETT